MPATLLQVQQQVVVYHALDRSIVILVGAKQFIMTQKQNVENVYNLNQYATLLDV
tara:strand:+ start:109 stop:273 length:165 start_codon:yes stop_codon:yes gene_type:complete